MQRCPVCCKSKFLKFYCVRNEIYSWSVRVNIVFELFCFALVWFSLFLFHIVFPLWSTSCSSWGLQLVSMSAQLIPRADGHTWPWFTSSGKQFPQRIVHLWMLWFGEVLKQRNLQHPINDESHCLQCLNKHLQMIENPHRCTQEYNVSSCSPNLPQVRMELWMCHLK